MFVRPLVRPFIRSFIRSSVRLLPAFLGIGSLVFSDFWHKGAKWQCPKSDWARFSKKKIFGQIWAKNCQKIGFFWTYCKIASLVFSDFWQKDRVQSTLKYGRKNFPENFFSSLITDFRFFGEIPFYHFSISCFSRDWLITFCWFLAQRCKMAMPKLWRSPISGKNSFRPKMPEICRKTGFLAFSRDFFISFFWFFP